MFRVLKEQHKELKEHKGHKDFKVQLERGGYLKVLKVLQARKVPQVQRGR